MPQRGAPGVSMRKEKMKDKHAFNSNGIRMNPTKQRPSNAGRAGAGACQLSHQPTIPTAPTMHSLPHWHMTYHTLRPSNAGASTTDSSGDKKPGRSPRRPASGRAGRTSPIPKGLNASASVSNTSDGVADTSKNVGSALAQYTQRLAGPALGQMGDTKRSFSSGTATSPAKPPEAQAGVRKLAAEEEEEEEEEEEDHEEGDINLMPD